MTLTIAPSHLGALVYLARNNAELVAFMGHSRRIGTEIPSLLDGQPIERKSRFILLTANGGLGRNPDIPRIHHRVQVACYGSTGADAALVARTLGAVFQPASRRPGRIVSSGCQIDDLWLSVSGTELMDDPGGAEWPYVVEQYELWMREQVYS